MIPRLPAHFAAFQFAESLYRRVNPIAWIACLILLGMVMRIPRFQVDFERPAGFAETVLVSESLAFRGEFANPYGKAPTGPTAHLSPGFPFVRAALITVLGKPLTGSRGQQILAGLALVVQLSLLPVVSSLLGFGPIPGLIAFLFGVLPINAYSSWEASYAGLLAVVSSLLWLLAIRKPSPLLGAAAGSAFGCLLNFSSVALFPTLLLAALYFVRTRSWWMPATIILWLLPWTVRNAVAFGELIVFRSNLGLELQVSNNDCASYAIRGNLASGCFKTFHPSRNVVEASRMAAIGEIAYYRMKQDQAIAWISTHPGRFLELTRQRLVAFWFPHERSNPLDELLHGRSIERSVIYLCTILTLPGLLLAARRTRFGIVLWSWLLLFPPIYYVVQYEDRYRAPIHWVSFLLAGLCLHSAASRILYGMKIVRSAQPHPAKSTG
ncbi:MAG: hypothetical protein ABI972_13795 [Acidobacteriota bacterium]